MRKLLNRKDKNPKIDFAKLEEDSLYLLGLPKEEYTKNDITELLETFSKNNVEVIVFKGRIGRNEDFQVIETNLSEVFQTEDGQ